MKIKPLPTISLLTLLFATVALITWSTTSHARAESSPTTQPTNDSVTRTELEKEKQRTLTKLVGAKAVFDASDIQFSQLSTAINQDLATDDALLGQREARDLQLNRLKLLQQNNTGSLDEIRQMNLDLDQIRMNIANRVETIRGRSHAGLYYEVAKANLNASLDLKQAQAQLDSIQSRLNQLQ